MARCTVADFYKAFRFMVVIEDDRMQQLSLLMAEQDPFTGDLFLVRGVEANSPMLCDILPEKGIVHVYLFGRVGARRITMSYSGVRRLPVLLDAVKSDVALERVVLGQVSYQRSINLTEEELKRLPEYEPTAPADAFPSTEPE